MLPFFAFLAILSSLVLNLVISIHHVSAFNHTMYALNNILGYDGEEECDDSLWGDNITSSGDDSAVAGGSMGEKLRQFIKEYGELTQELQVEYGVPWELVFGQAVAESGVGTATDPTAPNKMAADRGHYNWLGLMYGEDHKYNIKVPKGQRITNSHGEWNEYESLENMIKGYYIDFLRNGNYDGAFQYSTADNFDLEKFVVGSSGDPANPQLDGIGFAYVCGPYASSCNLSTYWKNIMTGVNTAHEVAAEEGWPTSEELAKQENIGVGGKHPDLKSTIDTADSDFTSDTSTINSSDPCKQSASSVNKTNTDSIAKMALNLAWPYEDGTCETSSGEIVEYKSKQGEQCYTNPKPSYAEALTKYNITGDAKDCGHFVAAVIYSAGVDSNFPKSGTGNILSHLQETTDIWEEIENTGDESTLRPGDVLVVYEGSSHHAEIYTGSLSDYGNLTSASQGTEVGITKNLESGIKHYQGNKYHIFRLKQSGSADLKSGGMTMAEAQAIMSEYLALPSSEWDKYSIPPGVSCSDGRLYNCVAFSKYFINKYTSNPQDHVGNGVDVVASLIAAGFEDGGTTPKPYAVFSVNKGSTMCGDKICGHTGVVFGIDADRGKIIIGEAGCGSGKDFTAIKEKDLSEYANGKYTYAYTDKYLKDLK